MTDLPGASAVLKGGVVSYTDEVKHNVLGVPQALLDQYGAVSPQVAEAMARGARRVLGCDLAVSTTGVAGPDPDDGGTPWDWYMWPWPARSSAMCRSSIWEGGAQWCAAGPPFTPSIW